MVSNLSAIKSNRLVNRVANSIYKFIIAELNFRSKILIATTCENGRSLTSVKITFTYTSRQIKLNRDITNQVNEGVNDGVGCSRQVGSHCGNSITFFITSLGGFFLCVADEDNTETQHSDFTEGFLELLLQHSPALSPSYIADTINAFTLTDILFTKCISNGNSINNNRIIHILCLWLTQLRNNFLEIRPLQHWQGTSTGKCVSTHLKCTNKCSGCLNRKRSLTNLRSTIEQ